MQPVFCLGYLGRPFRNGQAGVWPGDILNSSELPGLTKAHAAIRVLFF